MLQTKTRARGINATVEEELDSTGALDGINDALELRHVLPIVLMLLAVVACALFKSLGPRDPLRPCRRWKFCRFRVVPERAYRTYTVRHRVAHGHVIFYIRQLSCALLLTAMALLHVAVHLRRNLSARFGWEGSSHTRFETTQTCRVRLTSATTKVLDPIVYQFYRTLACRAMFDVSAAPVLVDALGAL